RLKETSRTRTDNDFIGATSGSLSRQRLGHAKAHDDGAEVGGIGLSRRRSQQPRRKHPGAAAINSEALALAVVRVGITRAGLVRAPVCGNAGVAVVVTVLGPLPSVPCHVVKAECVRRLRAHRMCLAMVAKKTFHFFAAGVGIEPGVDRSGSVVIAPVERGCRSGACGIFPLRFAGQPIRPVCWGCAAAMRLAVQPRDIGTRILPAHAHDWITVSLRMAGIFPSQLQILLIFEDGAAAAATITGRVSRLPSKCRVLATSDVIL